MKVGTKELKNRLSHYLRVVRAGEPVRVTDRGRVVAEIKRADGKGKPQGDAAALQELAASGLVTLGHGRSDDFQPVKPRQRGVRASQMILEDRG